LSLGVHVRRVFALSWAIAALVASMSGIVLGIINGVNVHDLSSIGLKVFPVVILAAWTASRRYYRRYNYRTFGNIHRRLFITLAA